MKDNSLSLMVYWNAFIFYFNLSIFFAIEFGVITQPFSKLPKLRTFFHGVWMMIGQPRVHYLQ